MTCLRNGSQSALHDKFICQRVEGVYDLFTLVLLGFILRVGVNCILIPTYKSKMQNEYDVKFQYLHSLTDEFVMQSWLKLIRQASPEVYYSPRYLISHFPPDCVMVNASAPRYCETRIDLRRKSNDSKNGIIFEKSEVNTDSSSEMGTQLGRINTTPDNA